MARKGGSELIIVLDDSDTSNDEEGFEIDTFTRKPNMNICKKMNSFSESWRSSLTFYQQKNTSEAILSPDIKVVPELLSSKVNAVSDHCVHARFLM